MEWSIAWNCLPQRGCVLPAQGNRNDGSWSFSAQRANPSPTSATNHRLVGPKKRLLPAGANPGRCPGLGAGLGLRPAGVHLLPRPWQVFLAAAYQPEAPARAGAKTLAGASGWYVVGSPARKSCRTRPFAGLAIGPSHPLRSGGRGRGRCQVQGVRCQARRRCCLTMRHERPPGGTFLWEGPRALSAGTRPTKPPRRRDRSGKSRNLGPKSPFGPERR